MSQIQSLESLPPEERAYIYQQVYEFQPFLLPDSQVEVQVSDPDGGDGDFAVSLKLTGGGTFVQAVGEGSSFFDAVRDAKQLLMEHLYAVQQQIHSDTSGIDEASEEPLH